jgi:hypothetical protein
VPQMIHVTTSSDPKISCHGTSPTAPTATRTS